MVNTTNRPTLNDPEEYALIKSMYFDSDGINSASTEPIEMLERQESKQRNLKQSSR